MKIRKTILLLLLIPILVQSAQCESGQISPVRLNQLGYRPEDPKIICIVDAQGEFEVIRNSDGQTVLSGEIGALKYDAASGDAVAYADLTALSEPGIYFVRTELGDSAEFRIAEDAYREAGAAALHFFTLQRCGQELTEAEAGRYAHEECHAREAIVYGTDATKLALGGWHDAGDFGRYVPAAGKAVMDLLLVRRDYPDVFGSALLDEIRYELDWMLQMQDEETGSVYHKLTSMGFEQVAIMPNQHKAPLYFSPISATATGDFAGVCAYASLFFGEADPEYAQALLQAAERAYSWLEERPDEPGFRNPPGISTGEYGDEEDRDERALAATALYLATGEPEYQEALRPLLGRYDGVGWADMGLYSSILYLQAPEELRDEAMYAKAKNALVDKANWLARVAESEGYRVTLRSGEYYWGSNMGVASNGMALLLANRYAPEDSYVRIAQDQLNYLFGQNANGLSYFTKFGSNSAKKPHHRPSMKVNSAMPGMLVGGPNTGLEDGIDAMRLRQLPPARQYNDNWGAYASNEVTIYWNSPLVYLLAAFQ